MQITGRQIVERAFRRLGVFAEGEPMTADAAIDALALLNELTDEWNAEPLMRPAVSAVTYTLIPGQSVYTMGSGGSFAARPPRELDALSVIPEGQTLEQGVELVSRQAWQAETLKAQTGPYPSVATYEDTIPLGTLTVWPVPTTAAQFRLYYAGFLTAFADLDTAYQVQEGYAAAFRLNLALKLAPEYGRPLDELLVSEANEAKARVKRSNEEVPVLAVDACYRGLSSFDMQTGGY